MPIIFMIGLFKWMFKKMKEKEAPIDNRLEECCKEIFDLVLSIPIDDWVFHSKTFWFYNTQKQDADSFTVTIGNNNLRLEVHKSGAYEILIINNKQQYFINGELKLLRHKLSVIRHFKIKKESADLKDRLDAQLYEAQTILQELKTKMK